MNMPSTVVAIVDDEEPIRRAWMRLLRSAGIESQGFASGLEFLESLATHEPDCVVLDLNMPGMTGFDVLSRLRANRDHIPVIVVTGYHSGDIERRANSAHPIAYLRKPMDDQQLLDAVERAFAARGKAADRSGTINASSK